MRKKNQSNFNKLLWRIIKFERKMGITYYEIEFEIVFGISMS